MFRHIKNIKITKNPFLLFVPFLLLYIILVAVFPTDGMKGDEGRYLVYARYIFYGFLPPNEAGFDYLGNGPGYSLILIPFVALHMPLIWITLMNAAFYYFSVVLLFKTLIQFFSFHKTLLVCLFWAFYYNLYESILFIIPETFSAFLICLLIFCVVNAFKFENTKGFGKYIYISGFITGYIALTKPIFGYVLLFMLAGYGLLWILNRKTTHYRRSLVILLVALITTMPYLIYTYKVTGQIFYWSTFGGNNLYWMSTPFEREYGDWFPDPKPISDPISKNAPVEEYEEYIRLNHGQDLDEINKYKGAERDDAYKRIAIRNIKSHPVKFLKNCFSNAGRIFFNYPYSYKPQKPETLLRFPVTGIMLILMLFCLFPTFINWQKITFSIRFLLFFALLYLGGSILGSAETRMFTVIVPILIFWIAFIMQNSINLNIRWQSKNSM